MKYRKVKIIDLVELINGFPFKSEDWGVEGTKIIRIQNLTELETTYNFTNKKVDNKYSINNGDLLISWSGSLGVYEWNSESALLNQHIFKVVFKNKIIDKRYFKYVINQALIELSHKARGIGLKHLKKGIIEQYEFNLPDIHNQEKAVAILNKIQLLLFKRKETINLLEEYINSKFIELFGDPIKNPFNLGKEELSKVTKLVSDGTHKTPKYVDSGIIFISARNINENSIDWKDVKYITKTEYNQLLSRGIPEQGDILLTKSGSLGRSAILDKEIEFGFYESVALIKCKRDVINPFFLISFLRTSAIQFELNDKKKGMAVKHLHLNMLRQLKILLPPLELQKKFEEIYISIENQLQRLKRSQYLFEELLQSMVYITFDSKMEISVDEIDPIIEDEIELELFLNTLNSSDFQSKELYNIEIEKLFKILSRTEQRNNENKTYKKGIIQRFEKNKIIIEANREYKNRLIDEAATS